MSLARPKSRIFTLPSSVTNRFSGFRSRCAIPFWCAAARPSRNLKRILQRVVEARGAELRLPQTLAQRLAFEQLEDDRRRTLVGADVVNRDNVWMVQNPGHAGFLFESAPPVAIGGVDGGQYLDGDVAPQAGVAGSIDFAHPAFTEQRKIW